MNANAKYFWLNVVPTSGVEDGSIAISGVEHTGRAARLFSLNVQTVSNDGQGGQEPAEPIIRNINGRQEAAAMFLNLSQGSGAAVEGNPDDLTDSEIIVSKAAGTITVTGTSNAQKLTISAAPTASDLGAGAQATVGAISITPSIEDAHGKAYSGSALTITNGENIAGDYGLFGSYQFEVVISYTANVESIDQEATITVVAEAAEVAAAGDMGGAAAAEAITKSFKLVQRAGDAYLFLNAMDNAEAVTLTFSAAGSPAQTVNVLSNVSWEVVEA